MREKFTSEAKNSTTINIAHLIATTTTTTTAKVALSDF